MKKERNGEEKERKENRRTKERKEKKKKRKKKRWGERLRIYARCMTGIAVMIA